MNKITKSILRHLSFGEAGFSLVEILVAITITSLLIGFASAIWLLGQEYYLRWERSFHLQNESHTLAHGLCEDIYRAEEIVDFKSGAITLRVHGSLREYYLENGTLIRDSVSLLSSGIRLLEFQLTPTGSAGEEGSVEPKEAERIDLELTLTNHEDTVQARRSIFMRKPSAWTALTEN